MNSTAPTDSELDKTFDRLFEIMQSQPFLNSSGIGNEVPIYIQPYAIAAQGKVDARIAALTSRLASGGANILSIDLLELVFEFTSKGDRLQKLLEKETTLKRDHMLSIMARWTDAKEHLVPAIREKIDSANCDITLVSGCGSVFPFLRTHTILENLQPVMDKKPMVFFFPGEYQHRDAAGSELRLFGCLSHKGYYRAFNLDHYHL